MVNIICALKCEANSLVKFFGLKKSRINHPFPLFYGEGVALIISGIGKLNAATACAYLHGLQTREDLYQQKHLAAWLNVGVAGHRTVSIGSGFLVLKVIDQESGHSWYPVWLTKLPSPSETVMTLSEPDRLYTYPMLVDMEAAAIMGTVSRFTTMEFVHCYKIVSDNKSRDADQFSAKEVEHLVGQKVKPISSIVEYLTLLLEQEYCAIRLPEQYAVIMHYFRFSSTQAEQAKKILYRWQVLSEHPILSVIPLEDYTNAKEFLGAVSTKLLELPKFEF